MKNDMRFSKIGGREACFFIGTMIAVMACFLIFVLPVQGVEAKKVQTPQYKYYTSIKIQPGDTLWTIAEDISDAYGLDVRDCVKELGMMNSIRNGDLIYAGNYLTVFYYSDEYK